VFLVYQQTARIRARIYTFYMFTLSKNLIASPSEISSAIRTLLFKGNRYVSDCLSGKSDVPHLLLPQVTSTGMEPNPRECFPYVSFNSFDCFLSIFTKCHAAPPGYIHTLDLTVYAFFFIKLSISYQNPLLTSTPFPIQYVYLNKGYSVRHWRTFLVNKTEIYGTI